MRKKNVKRIAPVVLILFVLLVFTGPSPGWSRSTGNVCSTPVGTAGSAASSTAAAKKSTIKENGKKQKVAADNFTAALDAYQKGLYQAAVDLLKAHGQYTDTDVDNAGIQLLLGACKEKLGEKKLAAGHFRRIKSMLDKGTIAAVPSIPGIAPETFATYREVFAEDTFFAFQEPVSVQDIMNYRVILAPRKTVEQKEKERKKKKFPWMLGVCTIMITGTVLVLAASAKKGDNKIPFYEIEWIRVPAGKFTMGDNFSEGDVDERPAHQVYLDEYSISKYEITYGQYTFFCQETNRYLSLADKEFWSTFSDTHKLPIVRVNWYEAMAFCEWLSQRIGKKCSLPTEAQWEKAARGTEKYRYPWGNNSPTCDIANYFGCGRLNGIFPSVMDVVYMWPGGVSPYGVYNMAGNVAEWCRDWYSPVYYGQSPENNPEGPATGTYKVFRGGSFNSQPFELRTTNRSFVLPSEFNKEIGFRVVIEDPDS